ncbi:short-chain dehydrogenase [Kalaharituber pfeilii]|nr:short-chain dehydrogenase [Kalaharituber pfeilii]
MPVTPIAGPVILVTGGSRGLGKSIAQLLLRPSASPSPVTVVTVSRSASASLSADESQVMHVQVDLSAQDGPRKAVTAALDTYGRLDGLVINHGALDPVERVAEGSDARGGLDGWKTSFDINFFSAVALVKAAIPELRKTKGRIVFVSSGAAVTAYTGWGPYSAAKAAMNSFCSILGVEEPDITSISIRPGVIDTEMQREIRERHSNAMGDVHQRFINLHTTGKLLRPEQPGTVIANLALKASNELSGKFLSWDAEELKEYH